jgi:hypothetical protein
MMLRAIVVVCAAGCLAIQAVRNAGVDAFANLQPSLASQFWSGHPATELSLGMTEIARASRARAAVPQSAFALIGDAAVKEPLSPEPFLVRGVQAQLAGEPAAAERAFEAAQRRNPRSLPAAYFLADRYFQTGDSAGGLREVGLLARLVPYGSGTLAPYLAAYAADPAHWPRLRLLFRGNPALASNTLTRLAANVSTVPAVLALADNRQSLETAPWFPAVLNTLVGAGRYDQARALWAKARGLAEQPGEFIHDTGFVDSRSPPPFNWSLTSSNVGSAERQPGHRLHVVFYGQEDGILASQLLVLSPGGYRLSLQLLGDRDRARVLTWSLWCDGSDAPISSVTLDTAAQRGWSVHVPAACPAQWLKLSGSSPDVAQQSDVQISALKLERIASGG